MKKIFTLTFVFLALVFLKSGAQTLKWVDQLGGTSSETSNSVVVDASGYVYSTGYFSGTSDFDPGSGAYNLTSAGFQDIFILKLDSSGNFIWAKHVGGTGTDYGTAIAVDANGNVYTTGMFQGSSIDFNPGSGTNTLSSVGPDAFVLKLNAAGNYLWAKKWGSSGGDQGNGIAIDINGNVSITGNFSFTVDFNPASGTFYLTTAGSGDVFINVLDSNGIFVRAMRFGGNAFDSGNSIAVDALGSIYATGYFKNNADFGPFNLTTVNASEIFVCKVNTVGNVEWARQMGGTLSDEGKSIAVDSLSNVYISGYFEDNASFDPGGVCNLSSAGGRDAFLCKLDGQGNFAWAKRFGGINGDESWSVNVDDVGNIFTAGYFRDITNFDPGNSNFSLTSFGNTDGFISKADASGNFQWAIQFGGAGMDQVYSSAIDRFRNIYSGGRFDGISDFDPDTAIFNLAPWGLFDIFIHKMGVELNDPGPLSVQYLEFDAQKEGTHNNLFWATASENNNDYFEILRGSNKIEFEIIGTTEGNGTSTQTHHYTFTDKNPLNQINYYRLRQFDYNGDFRYSKIISIDNISFEIMVGPNPVDQWLNVQSLLYKVENIEIFNYSGKEIYNKDLSTFNYQLSTTDFPNGIYLIKTYTNGGVFQQKLVINHP